MWRTLVSPVLHRQVGILRISSGNCSSRVSFVHVNGSFDKGNLEELTAHQNLHEPVIRDHISLSKAQNIVCGLFGKVSDIENTVKVEPLFVVQCLLEKIKEKRLGTSTSEDHLTICSPRNEKNGKESGFGFRSVYLGIEKWCYGVVVVSSLISWHRLLLNDENDVIHHIHKDCPSLLPSHVLPVNGPAKPIDPIEAAISSFEDAMTDCTAVTQNALGIKLSTLSLHGKALMYFKSASKNGNIAAHFNLGLCYERGIGTAKDTSKAINSYSFAASRGHLEASYNLGVLYLQGEHNQKQNEGLELIEKAAEKGLVKAQRFLGLYYADETNQHHDMMTSVKWLQAAADQNDTTAQYHLGICCEQGLGIGRNMRQAKAFYAQAAENGHPDAQYNFGVFHEHGLGGLSVNKREALRWYTMSSDQGNTNAKHNLECLQDEMNDIEKENEKSGLLRRFLPDFLNFKEPVATSGILPRCSSSPGRLYQQLNVVHDSPEQNQIQQNAFEDKKCIWVI